MTVPFNRRTLADAIRGVGVRAGNVVFSHSNVGYFGFPEEGRTPQIVFDVILGAFQDVIGPAGTLVVPTFTYSFTKREVFDPAASPSTCGAFTEMLRKHPEAKRSEDPIFSVAAVGSRAAELTADAPEECFGPGSFWDRFLTADGVVCNLNFDSGSTYLHYVERLLNVPYRFQKEFVGIVRKNGVETRRQAVYFVRDMADADTAAAFESFDQFAREAGFSRSAKVGRGAVVGLRAADCVTYLKDELTRRPWLLTAAAKTGSEPDPVIAKAARVVFPGPDDLPALGATMHAMALDLFPICRSLTGDGVRLTLGYLARLLPGLQVHAVPSGTPAFDWTVPPEWTVRDAFVADEAGNRVIDFRKNNLHLLGYSEPVDRVVPWEELNAHLHSRPDLPDAIPYVTSYYRRTWGFCLTQRERDRLTRVNDSQVTSKPPPPGPPLAGGEEEVTSDALGPTSAAGFSPPLPGGGRGGANPPEPSRTGSSATTGPYRVKIDTTLAPGVLNYAEWVWPGETADEILLSAYVCHPSMANNELSGPVVAAALAKWVMSQPRRYTYRVLFVPETIGAITYISRHVDRLKRDTRAAFVLTCCGDERSHSFMPSRFGNTLPDRVARAVLREYAPAYKEYSFLQRGSDERQLCSPGVDLPVVSMMRSKYGSADFPEYHTSLDDLTLVTPAGLAGGYEAVRRALTVLEENRRYRVTTPCEPMLSKRGLYRTLGAVGPLPDETRVIKDFCAYADGTLDLVALSEAIQAPIMACVAAARKLREIGLIEPVD